MIPINKIFIFLILCIQSFISVSQEFKHESYREGWVLSFNDEFDSLNLNTNKWSTGFPWGRWTGGNMLNYYTDGNNLSLNGGNLVIKSDDDTLTGVVDLWDSLGNYIPYSRYFNYTSGMIFSKKSFKYGLFECRSKVPQGKGYNAAFWLYGENSCEIDVFEIIGSNTSDAQMTLHWKTPDVYTNTTQWPSHKIRPTPSFSDTFSTFAVRWLANEVTWIIDQADVIEPPFTQYIRGNHIPDVNMNIIFTNEIGTMDGNPDNQTPFPAYFYIDYVRAYSKDTIAHPYIYDQVPLFVSKNDTIDIVHQMLFVRDSFNTYPLGFKILLDTGQHYILNGNKIIALNDEVDTLYVPMIVNDGINNSNIYVLKISLGAAYIKERNEKNHLIVYPNPTQDYLYITLPVEEKIKTIFIYDSYGRIDNDNPELITNSLNISNLSTGIYILKVICSKKTYHTIFTKY